MDLFNKDPKPAPTIMRDRSINDRIPDGLFLACPYCGAQSYSKQLGPFRVCQNCGYGFRLQAHERVDLLTDSFDEMNADLKLGAVTFPGYQEKLDRARQQTDLQDSILTGIATIGE